MERNGKSLGEFPIMSIENPTLAHSWLTFPLQLSRIIYKSALLCKTKPISKKSNECILIYNKGLQKKDPFAAQKNKANSKPNKANFQTRRRFFSLLHKRLPPAASSAQHGERPFGPGSREAGYPRNDLCEGSQQSIINYQFTIVPRKKNKK
jgi:hypothetical protein